MKLKQAILQVMSRDEMKQACIDLEIADVDLRSVESMGDGLASAKRAKPKALIEYLGEPQVKEVAELVGVDPTGRRCALIERLLNPARSIETEDDSPAPAPASARGEGSRRRAAAEPTGVAEGSAQYVHLVEAVQRPGAGLQDQFQLRKPPKTYRYDSSLDPALSWDEQPARELGEWLIALIARAATEGEAKVFAEPQEWAGGGVKVASLSEAAQRLQSLSKPFLNWAGKAERHEIKVPTVPLFVHERHSTKAILDGIRHRKAQGQTLDLFGDAPMELHEQLEAYEHKGPWQNRMILGDSLQVMNSLLELEGLGGQVQMIYMDPPYGVKFGSNFQPFVRKRDVKHGGDEDMTREPEMVKAYRDTWELGLHSYLTYLRDRLLIARDLLAESGSIIVQISDENLHHAREIMDEVFGAENFCALIAFQKTSGASSPDAKVSVIGTVADYLLWYARDSRRMKYRQLFVPSDEGKAFSEFFSWIEQEDGKRRRMSDAERLGAAPVNGKRFALSDLTSQNDNQMYSIQFNGETYRPGRRGWRTTESGMRRLIQHKRIETSGTSIRYVQYANDFAYSRLQALWGDTGIAGFSSSKLYVVQTNVKVVQRCLLMCTDPGDLVLDPTCGSGTTAYVAEHWGRRWITIDTSRVPLALARQRLLTATYPFYELKAPELGPSAGFVYRRKQNRKGEEIGGLVPHVTLKSIANDEPPAMEVLVDRPDEIAGVTRVSGPFVVEATIAPAQAVTVDAEVSLSASADTASHLDRMTEVLRQSKSLRLPGNRELVLFGIRRTADAEYLHAEASEGGHRVAIVFGPADGAISSALVYEAGREAHYLKYDAVYFFGFAVEPGARNLIEDTKKLRLPAAYVAVTPDVAMSDLLKTTRASEIFSITGLPDIAVRQAKKKGPEGALLHEVELKGLDLFDPASLATESIDGASVPCWMLDTDYDGVCFHASQVFFPRTAAWDNLQRSLRAQFDASVWEHLAGTVSEAFVLGKRRRIAVKVIDERGNELLRVLEVPA
jgi:adenine-specific DNA-methyltransferase